MSDTDRDRAERDAYCCIAEASLLRDADHARCACDFLHRLIPRPRRSDDALVEQQAQDQ